MIAKVYSIIPDGYTAQLIEVEGDISKNLPAFNIVGMANKTVSEARERVRSAITNSSLTFPAKKVTISLAPAELNKDGAHLDLPIALAVLSLSQQILQSDLTNRLFVGELSLNGYTKPVRGIINIIEAARDAGYPEIFIPTANLSQATLVSGIKIIGVTSLLELVLHLKGVKPIITSPSHPKPIPASPNPKAIISLPNSHPQSIPNQPLSSRLPSNQPFPHQSTSNQVKNTTTPYPTFDDIRGQDFAKRALTIAVAGHHNILLYGPPGAGKTLLAKAAAHLLPPPTAAEQIEIAKIYSLHSASEPIPDTRPFRHPHHTASYSAIIGGGLQALPGEISLAHRGVLFLDELPEYPRKVLESLRQPLEDHQITVARLHHHATYPADFMLMATMNPCPCGYLGDPNHPCTCSAHQIELYRKHLSGPILDRIDLVIQVTRTDTSILFQTPNDVKNTSTPNQKYQHQKHQHQECQHPEHQSAQDLIHRAIQTQRARYQQNASYNSHLTPQSISNSVKLTPTAEALLKQATDTLNLSARVFFKVIKVAQTIADLEQSPTILPEHISEAISYRQPIP